MPQPSVQGRFIWQELMTEDTAAATAFYPKVVGWKSEASAANPDYTVYSAASAPVAGMMLLPEAARKMGSKPQWIPYLGSDDIDASVTAVERLGGKTLRPPQDIENVGRFAIVADPQGAAFALYKPSYDVADKGPPKPGEFSWQELATSDHEAAFNFYRELFGWQVVQRMDMGPAGTYLIFGADGIQRGGAFTSSKLPAGPYWLSYVTVSDTEAAVAMAKAAGGRLVMGPKDVPGGGRIAQLLDSSGVLFAVYAFAKASPAKKPGSKPAVNKTPTTNAAVAKPATAKPATAPKPAIKSAPTASVAPPKKVVNKPATIKTAAKKSAAKKSANKKSGANRPAAKSVKKSAKRALTKRKAAPARKRVAARAKAKVKSRRAAPKKRSSKSGGRAASAARKK